MGVKNFMINKLFMKNKKIWIILTVVALTFLFVGAVSAAEDNGTIKNSKTLSYNVEESKIQATFKEVNNVNNVKTKITSKKVSNLCAKKYYTKTVKLQKVHYTPQIRPTKLKTGVLLCAYYVPDNSGQFNKGIYIGTQFYPFKTVDNTKLLGVQIAFRGHGTTIYKLYKKTSRCGCNFRTISLPRGYTPIKAKVWYRHK